MVLWRKEVDLKFDLHGMEAEIGVEAKCIPVNSRIASVVKRMARVERKEKRFVGGFGMRGEEVGPRGWRGEGYGDRFSGSLGA